MRFIDVVNKAGCAGKTVGKQIADVVGKVNPDVWRELAYASACAYSLFLPKREEVQVKPGRPHMPVVLVHGLGANRGTWLPFRSFLRLYGMKRVYAFGYEQGDVKTHAKNLKKFIHEVMEINNAEEVNIVAHSLGGVISRYAIQRLGMGKSINTLITLATPHQGTYAAQYANTTLTLELRPDSDLMKEINKESISKYPVRVVAYYSDRDMYVVPFEKMTLPDAENIFIPHISHTQFILSPTVFQNVYRVLSDQPLKNLNFFRKLRGAQESSPQT